MITDRWKFSSEDGVYEMKKDDFKLPSDCWKWNSDWVYEQNISDVNLLTKMCQLNNFIRFIWYQFEIIICVYSQIYHCSHVDH